VEGENWVALVFGGLAISITLRLVWGLIRAAWRESQLRAHGTRAVATIQSVKQTGGSSNDNPELELRVYVTPAGGSAFDARFKAVVQLLDVHRMQRGQKLQVCFDPKDRKRVTLASRYLVEPDPEPESEPDPGADS
jgi:uncharacterized protein DUF3592